MAATNKRNPEAFPIRTVAALTGINPITLRTWERRYGLIEPVRTPKGHRLYTKEHISMLNRVVDLLDQGISISQINFAAISTDPERLASQEEEFWAKLTDRMIVAISNFNEAILENAYNEAMALYPIETVTQKLLLPLLAKLGNRWASGDGTVAEEHFFGVYLRNKLGARFHHRKRLDSGPKLIMACVPDDRHEIGLLLFALAAYDQNFRCILLGADMPLEDLPDAVTHSESQAIVLSASFPGNINNLAAQISALVKRSSVPVFVGGSASVTYRTQIQEAGAHVLGSDFDGGLKKINAILSH